MVSRPVVLFRNRCSTFNTGSHKPLGSAPRSSAICGRLFSFEQLANGDSGEFRTTIKSVGDMEAQFSLALPQLLQRRFSFNPARVGESRNKPHSAGGYRSAFGDLIPDLSHLNGSG